MSKGHQESGASVDFIWPYGGRQVHLCGSFNSSLPSSKLLATYHEFKFHIDGEWRYDNQASIARDASGNVNNYVEVKIAEAVRDQWRRYNPRIKYGRRPELSLDRLALSRARCLKATSSRVSTTPYGVRAGWQGGRLGRHATG